MTKDIASTPHTFVRLHGINNMFGFYPSYLFTILALANVLIQMAVCALYLHVSSKNKPSNRHIYLIQLSQFDVYIVYALLCSSFAPPFLIVVFLFQISIYSALAISISALYQQILPFEHVTFQLLSILDLIPVLGFASRHVNG